MAQARGGQSTRAVDSLSDGNPKELNENQRLEERDDGSVWLIETKPSGSVISRRVDSEGDLDHSSKGGKVWFRRLLAAQARKDEAAKAPKTSRKKSAPVTTDE